MNERTMRYLTGVCFTGIAACLLYAGEPVWSLLPAVAGFYVLGSLLYEKIFVGR